MGLEKFIQESYIDAFRGLRKEIWYIALIQLINRSGMMVVPFMTLYLTQDLEWTKTQAGIATACFGVGNLIGSFLGGWLADRIPPLKIMFFSLFAGGICFILMAWVTSFYLLCIWITITITVADVMRPASMVAISEYTTKTTFTRGISLLRLAINLGIAVGPALGGFLIARMGYSMIFIADGITCILASFFLYYIFNYNLNALNIKDDKEERVGSGSPYSDYPFLWFLFFNLIMLVIFFQILYSVPVFFREVFMLTEDKIGSFFMMNGLLIFALEMPIIFALEKRGLIYKPLIWGILLIGLSYLFFLAPFSNVWITIVLFNAVISIGEIINFPYISTVAVHRGEGKNKGAYMGAVSASFSISFIFAPIAFLPFVDQFGYNWMWIICAITCLFLVFGLLFLKPYFKGSFK